MTPSFKESGDVETVGIQKDEKLATRKAGKKRDEMVIAFFHFLVPNAEHHKAGKTRMTFN